MAGRTLLVQIGSTNFAAAVSAGCEPGETRSGSGAMTKGGLSVRNAANKMPAATITTRLCVFRRARALGEDCDGIVRGVTVGGTLRGDLKRPSGQVRIIAHMNKYTLEPFRC